MRGAIIVWRHPVRPVHLWLVLGFTLLVWLVVLAMLAHQAVRHGWATVPLAGQVLPLSLPKGLRANALIGSEVRSRLDLHAHVSVPIDQSVSVTVAQVVTADTVVDTVLPVSTSVRFRGDIAVDTLVAVDVPVVSWLPRFRVTLPVKAMVPVDITLPVIARVPLTLSLPIQGRFLTPLRLPIKAGLSADLRVNDAINGRIINQAEFTLVDRPATLPVGLRKADIRVPLNRLSLHAAP